MTTSRFDIKEHIVEASHIREYPRALAGRPTDVLKLQVKQYTPKNPSRLARAITIIGAHANGFAKELYEPLWDDIYDHCIANGSEIASVWICDVAWQGQSSVLNDELLGNDPNWFDHSRDLLHVINTFRHQMTWPLVGIGHSMGGCQLTNLALFHPRLFASLILIDPVIGLTDSINSGNKMTTMNGPNVANLSTYRKDIWSSREEAAQSFRRSPVYKAWDPRVLDRLIQYGLHDLPTVLYPESPKQGSSPVTLTTPKAQEVWSFLRPNYDGRDAHGKPIINRDTQPDIDLTADLIYPLYRPEQRIAYLQLPHLRPPTYYIMGGTSNLGSREAQYEKVPRTGTGVGGSGGQKEGKVGYVYVEGVGHLVPMDAPSQTAELAAKWLGKMLSVWFEKEENFQQSWSRVSLKEKRTLDARWLENMGPPPTRKPKNKL